MHSFNHLDTDYIGLYFIGLPVNNVLGLHTETTKDSEETLQEEPTTTCSEITKEFPNDSLNSLAPESPRCTPRLLGAFESPVTPSETSSRSLNIWETPSRLVDFLILLMVDKFYLLIISFKMVFPKLLFFIQILVQTCK